MSDLKGVLLFDIDGVIRDVTCSYRLAIQETVAHFTNWHPTIQDIDHLKTEGCWNNDWDASTELIRRYIFTNRASIQQPDIQEVIRVFSDFYFGGDPDGDPSEWKGFIHNEPLLVDHAFFSQLTLKGFAWGFVSGAESPSAKFVIERRLGLKRPPLISMGEAPDKPNPEGLIKVATQLAGKSLGLGLPPVAYLGDTVADVITVKKARENIPDQKFVSLAIAPPHLHGIDHISSRKQYEDLLKSAGADRVLNEINDLIKHELNLDQLTK